MLTKEILEEVWGTDEHKHPRSYHLLTLYCVETGESYSSRAACFAGFAHNSVSCPGFNDVWKPEEAKTFYFSINTWCGENLNERQSKAIKDLSHILRTKLPPRAFVHTDVENLIKYGLIVKVSKLGEKRKAKDAYSIDAACSLLALAREFTEHLSAHHRINTLLENNATNIQPQPQHLKGVDVKNSWHRLLAPMYTVVDYNWVFSQRREIRGHGAWGAHIQSFADLKNMPRIKAKTLKNEDVDRKRFSAFWYIVFSDTMKGKE